MLNIFEPDVHDMYLSGNVIILYTTGKEFTMGYEFIVRSIITTSSPMQKVGIRFTNKEDYGHASDLNKLIKIIKRVLFCNSRVKILTVLNSLLQSDHLKLSSLLQDYRLLSTKQTIQRSWDAYDAVAQKEKNSIQDSA